MPTTPKAKPRLLPPWAWRVSRYPGRPLLFSVSFNRTPTGDWRRWSQGFWFGFIQKRKRWVEYQRLLRESRRNSTGQ